MKFISRNMNLMVVIRPGLPAQPITGTPATPTVSVRFQDGVADVNDEGLVKSMLSHPAFNTDFVTAEEDAFSATRRSAEPAHAVTSIQYGTPVAKTVTGTPGLTPEMTKLINDQAKEIAKAMLPGMIQATMEAMAASATSAKAPSESVETPEPLVDSEEVQDASKSKAKGKK